VFSSGKPERDAIFIGDRSLNDRSDGICEDNTALEFSTALDVLKAGVALVVVGFVGEMNRLTG
jgi:hypothetical protein